MKGCCAADRQPQHPFIRYIQSVCVIPNEVRDLPAYEFLQAFV
jgi:hypothetical protein